MDCATTQAAVPLAISKTKPYILAAHVQACTLGHIVLFITPHSKSGGHSFVGRYKNGPWELRVVRVLSKYTQSVVLVV